MIDIAPTLKTAENNECSILKALLNLLDVTIKEEENVIRVLQPEPPKQSSG